MSKFSNIVMNSRNKSGGDLYCTHSSLNDDDTLCIDCFQTIKED